MVIKGGSMTVKTVTLVRIEDVFLNDQLSENER